MPPNQNQFPAPSPTPGEPGHDPYAFFMSPQKPARQNPLNFGSGLNNKILIALAAVVAIILVIVIASLLSSGGKQKSQELISLAQTQQEVIRVATDGTRNAQSTELQNFATTTVVSVSSDQRLLLAQLTKSGTKVSPKELALGKNAQTDQALAAAQAANTYDTTFASTMQGELTAYQSKLNTVYKGTTSPGAKSLLKKQYDNATQLNKQLQASNNQ